MSTVSGDRSVESEGGSEMPSIKYEDLQFTKSKTLVYQPLRGSRADLCFNLFPSGGNKPLPILWERPFIGRILPGDGVRKYWKHRLVLLQPCGVFVHGLAKNVLDDSDKTESGIPRGEILILRPHAENENWAQIMDKYIGMTGVITDVLHAKDNEGQGKECVRIDRDGKKCAWRVDDMIRVPSNITESLTVDDLLNRLGEHL